MILEAVFKNVNFVNRYQNICEEYNDFENGLRGNKKKMYLEVLKKIDDTVFYHPKDKMFQVDFKYKKYSLNLGLSIHDGIVEARIFYLEDEEWLIYNRFDFIAEQLKEGFRSQFTNPKYTSKEELEIILKDIFGIYEDCKVALVEYLK